MTKQMVWPPGRSLGAGVLLVALGLAGCGESGPKLYPIEGQVTYVGKPVPSGTIRFEPAGDKRDPRASPETLIREGRYTLSRDKGIAGGRYTVYILAGDGKSQGEMPYGNTLFPPYYVTQVDLPQEGGTHDFHIPQQKGAKR
jgi:hypothetical protein